MSKKSFLLHIDSLCILDELTNEQRGELFYAIYQYQLGNEIALNPIIKIAFSQFKNQFLRDDEKYQTTCERRKEAGSKGGKQRVANQANATNCKQVQANQADNKNKNKNKKDNDNNKDISLFNKDIINKNVNDLKDEDFTLTSQMYFKDLPNEYLEVLETYINKYIDEIEMQININGGDLSKVYQWQDFRLSAYNYTSKKYVNFAMVYRSWARKNK